MSLPDIAAAPEPPPDRPPRQLDRGLTAAQCFTIGFGSIIGTGWLLVLGSWLGQAGPLGAILAFAAGGVLMMGVSLCYAEMATTLPVSGGEVAFAYQAFGERTSFAIGWLLALVYIAVTAFEAISAAWLIGALVPGSEGPVLYTIKGSPVRLSTLLIGVGGTIFLAWLNIRGIRFAARFQDIFTWSKIVISVLFLGAGILFGKVANLEPLFQTGPGGVSWSGVVSVFVTTAFWYTGFNMIPQAMGEIAPGTSMRRVGHAMLISVAVAIAFYCLVILSASMAAPWKSLVAESLPAAAAFQAAFNSSILTKTVLLAALFGILTAWNPCILSASRILYVLGRARIVAPGLGAVHPRFGTPSRAVAFVAAVACVGVFLGRSAILPIVNVSAIAMGVAYTVTCLGLIKLRRTDPHRPRPYRVPGGIVTAGIGVVSSAFMLVMAIIQPYQAAKGDWPAEWIAFGAWIAIGIAFWMFAPRDRAGLDEPERQALLLGSARD